MFQTKVRGKRWVLFIALFFGSFSLGTCRKSEPESSPHNGAPEEKGCLYSYAPGTTKLRWTAFKYTDRTAVGGEFKEFRLTGAVPSVDPLDVIRHVEFEVPVESVDSANPQRDKKIRDFFFGAMQNSSVLRGRLKSLDSRTGGHAIVALRMNGVDRDLPMDYTLDGEGGLLFKGSLNLGFWSGGAAIASLNRACAEKHTGKDGVTKLWPDVEIQLSTHLHKECGKGT